MISFAQLVVSVALPASLNWLFHCSLKLKIAVCVNLKTEIEQQQVELLPRAAGWYAMKVVISNFGNLSCFSPGWSLQLLPWVVLHTGELGCLLSHRLCGSWVCPLYSWSALHTAPQSLLTIISITGRFKALNEAYLSKSCNNEQNENKVYLLR